MIEVQARWWVEDVIVDRGLWLMENGGECSACVDGVIGLIAWNLNERLSCRCRCLRRL